MSVAVIDYTQEGTMLLEENRKARDFIENVILRNLEKNDKVLISVTENGMTCMPTQHKITEKKVDAGVINQVFHLVKKYGISSKMIFSNKKGDMFCEFWQ